MKVGYAGGGLTSSLWQGFVGCIDEVFPLYGSCRGMFHLTDPADARLIGIVAAIKDIGRAPRGVYSSNFWLPKLYQK